MSRVSFPFRIRSSENGHPGTSGPAPTFTLRVGRGKGRIKQASTVLARFLLELSAIMGEWKFEKSSSQGPSLKALLIGGVILWALVMTALVAWLLTRGHHFI